MPVIDTGPTPGSAELTLAGLATLGPGTACDEEPIHLSGAIQPHGFLLGVEPVTREVWVASENTAQYLGHPAAEILGKPLVTLFGSTVAAQVAPLLAADPGIDVHADPLSVEFEGRGRFEVVAHRSGPLVILEFDRSLAEDTAPTTYHRFLRRTLDPRVALSDVRSVCDATAEHIRGLTGFDRVLIYRFDEQAHGAVVSASVSPGGGSSLVGLHYPAADIPRQARALLLQKRVRMIADVDYTPVGLLALAGRVPVSELDLTMSDLRTVSPVHLQYLHEMGVAATLSVSLVCNDQLWGLILCHHLQPRHIPHPVRAVCETVAWSLSLQLDVLRNRDERERSARRERSISKVVAVLGEADAPPAAAAGQALTELVDADGVFLRLAGETAFTGSDLDGLGDPDAFVTTVSGLGARAPDAAPTIWSTDRLGESELGDSDLSAATIAGAPVAGVLVLSLGGDPGDAIVWVRREEVEVVTWAGATPDDHPGVARAGADDPSPAAHRPRDFQPRREVGRGHSRPWDGEELEAALTLAVALPEVLLRRARRLLVEQASRARADLAAAGRIQQRLEVELQRKLRLESLGQLAGGVAHDFNNLLSVILSYAEFVNEAVRTTTSAMGTPDWNRVAEDTVAIMEATRRAAALTRQLLTFARRDVSQPRAVAFNSIVLSLEPLLRRTLGSHIDLRLSLTDELTTVLADPEQLERVLVNLTVNARDAMPDGGTLTVGTDRTTVSIGDVTDGLAAAAGAYVRLRVADTGTGIPRDVLDRVFDPFFTTKAEGDGSGLGLSTVHGIVHQAGGRVHIYSEPGDGTVITVLLPVSDADLPAVAVAGPGPLPPRVHDRTVLLVEDQPAIREVTGRTLQAHGYRVLLAEDGPAAIGVAADFDGPIDILLTDVVMPGMLGREVAARIERVRPAIRTVFMSGFALVAATGQGRLDPGSVVLDKPFTRIQLLSMLAALDQRDS